MCHEQYFKFLKSAIEKFSKIEIYFIVNGKMIKTIT